jgi:phenylacetate-CoA ligase
MPEGDFYHKANETMTAKQRTSYLNRKLKWMAQYAYDHAPAMKEIMDNAGVKPSQIRTTQDLEKLPITMRDHLIGYQKKAPPFGGFLGIPLHELGRMFIHAGPANVAVPLPILRSAKKYWERWAETMYGLGVRRGDIVIVTLSFHWVGAGQMCSEAVNSVGAVTIPSGPGNLELQVKTMVDLGVTVYFGTPTFLYDIANKAKELNYNFPKDFSLRLCLFTTERISASLREIYEKGYGIDVRGLYSTNETGGLAYECPAKNGMHVPHNVIIEIVNPETGKQVGPGEVGQIVVTLLDTYQPILRLGTPDLSSYTDEPCACGRTSPRILGVVGKIGDAIKIRTMFCHHYQVNEVVSKIPQIGKYQIVVSHGANYRDDMTFRVEPVQEDADKEQVSQALKKNMKEICKLTVDKVEFLPQGVFPEKYEWVVDTRTYE